MVSPSKLLYWEFKTQNLKFYRKIKALCLVITTNLVEEFLVMYGFGWFISVILVLQGYTDYDLILGMITVDSVPWNFTISISVFQRLQKWELNQVIKYVLFVLLLMVYRINSFSTEKNVKFYSKIQAMVHSDLMSLDVGLSTFPWLRIEKDLCLRLTEMWA